MPGADHLSYSGKSDRPDKFTSARPIPLYAAAVDRNVDTATDSLVGTAASKAKKKTKKKKPGNAKTSTNGETSTSNGLDANHAGEGNEVDANDEEEQPVSRSEIRVSIETLTQIIVACSLSCKRRI
jgi:hypothetical protein